MRSTHPKKKVQKKQKKKKNIILKSINVSLHSKLKNMCIQYTVYTYNIT